MLSLSIPIYNHFRYGDLNEKRARLRQAELSLENTEEKADLAVRKAKRDYAAAGSNRTTLALKAQFALLSLIDAVGENLDEQIATERP